MNHLIITRVNLHMKLDPYQYKDTELWKRDGWNEDRINLLNNWARKSLQKQNNQNFIYITLWQKGYADNYSLSNEIKLEIDYTNTEDDKDIDYKNIDSKDTGKKTLGFSNQIVNKIKENFSGPVIITTLDCDDALHYNYVNIISSYKNKFTDFIILDVSHRYQYNIKTKAKGIKKRKNPSPMMSCFEPYIKCIPIIYNHSKIPIPIEIKKIKNLKGLQTINNSNSYSTDTDDPAQFNLCDFI
jgi:hypothetical protein